MELNEAKMIVREKLRKEPKEGLISIIIDDCMTEEDIFESAMPRRGPPKCIVCGKPVTIHDEVYDGKCSTCRKNQ